MQLCVEIPIKFYHLQSFDIHHIHFPLKIVNAYSFNAMYADGALLDSVFGDYEGSYELYQRALNVCPDHTLTLCNFGALLNDIYKDYAG